MKKIVQLWTGCPVMQSDQLNSSGEFCPWPSEISFHILRKSTPEVLINTSEAEKSTLEVLFSTFEIEKGTSEVLKGTFRIEISTCWGIKKYRKGTKRYLGAGN